MVKNAHSTAIKLPARWQLPCANAQWMAMRWKWRLTEGDGDIATQHIGKLVMEELKRLDKVAYIRYASVYRDFSEAKDFEDFVENELLD
jgi:transcriptional regulator NrdR family protein